MNENFEGKEIEQPQLFGEPIVPVPLSPGQQNRRDTQRREWRRRQRRSRAVRRLAERVDAARADGVEAQILALAEEKRLHDERLQELADCQSPILFEWIKSHYKLWAAIFLGGKLADRVFDSTDGQHLPQPLPLIFDAARSLHERGQLVTTKGIDKELRKAGVIMMPHFLAMLDDVLGYQHLPKRFTLDDVDDAIVFSREA